MALADFIPAGRTSLVKRGEKALQLQTEYAYRPVPRITTTVSIAGQVLHKIERGLDKPVENLEEKQRMEVRIQRQHTEIKSIIEDPTLAEKLLGVSAPDVSQSESEPEPEFDDSVLARMAEVESADEEPEVTPGKAEQKEGNGFTLPTANKPLPERVASVPGVGNIYRLDEKGNFANAENGKRFRKQFSSVFKGLAELLTLFLDMTQVGPVQKVGVYEIERSRLYLLSPGKVFYIVHVARPSIAINYEQAFKTILEQQPSVRTD